MTMNPIYTLGVLALWTMGPLVKKQILFQLEPPVYTLAHTTVGALVACVGALHAQVRHKEPVQPHVVGLLLLGACLSVSTNFLLASLLKNEPNPGKVMAVLNAASTMVTYLSGALLYSTVNLVNTGGALLIAMGIYFVSI